MPLIDHYQAQGVLHPVDGSGATEAITEQLLAVLDAVGLQERMLGYVRSYRSASATISQAPA